MIFLMENIYNFENKHFYIYIPNLKSIQSTCIILFLSLTYYYLYIIYKNDYILNSFFKFDLKSLALTYKIRPYLVKHHIHHNRSTKNTQCFQNILTLFSCLQIKSVFDKTNFGFWCNSKKIQQHILSKYISNVL